MYYELIYENGEVSVANYDTDDVALEAIEEQHNRAKTGGKNGPQGGACFSYCQSVCVCNTPWRLRHRRWTGYRRS